MLCMAGGEASMKSRPAKKAIRVVIFVVVIAVILALPLWFDRSVVLSP